MKIRAGLTALLLCFSMSLVTSSAAQDLGPGFTKVRDPAAEINASPPGLFLHRLVGDIDINPQTVLTVPVGVPG